MSKRLVRTIDHLVGVPSSPPPLKFTRSIHLVKGYFRCAFARVLADSKLPPSRFHGYASGSSERTVPWFHDRLDVRLDNLRFVVTKKMPAMTPADSSGGHKPVRLGRAGDLSATTVVAADAAAEIREPETPAEIDSEETFAAERLEFLVPTISRNIPVRFGGEADTSPRRDGGRERLGVLRSATLPRKNRRSWVPEKKSMIQDNESDEDRCVETT